ncbi:hypothetical protein EVJ58_g305 [Rhodofomes roseus]|uniref:Aminoglycoside phosphotransferase domain-containing protein n=1 Tax=Rhodofomes roseus TaxID=34475 RepID=A0A4Y9Z752_9APHY|nr:hypothetical protein EVJ58_g305 [Rhodofomes roseus]
MSTGERVLTYVAPSEAALNSAFRDGYNVICGLNVEHLIDAARAALRLHKTAAPNGIRILAHGAYNKVFLIEFGSTSLIARVPLPQSAAARDPIRFKSYTATLEFMALSRPDVPVPRILSAQPSRANPADVPYTLAEFCKGTSIAHLEWLNMPNTSKGIIVDLLAEQWAKIAAPVPFNALGSIMADGPSTSSWMWQGRSAPQRTFRIIPMIPRYVHDSTTLLDPSMETRCGPTTIAEHWHYHLDAARHSIAKIPPDDDEKPLFMQCLDTLRELVNIASSLDPLMNLGKGSAAPEVALMHVDFAFWRNVLFSADRTRIEGIVDWDDAIVVPRDIAAQYPEELTHHAWPPDPADVFAIPPGTLFEDTPFWRLSIEETHLRKRFRDALRKFDPELATLYTDRRARFRRRVDHLVTQGWRYWAMDIDWILNTAMDEARALSQNGTV